MVQDTCWICEGAILPEDNFCRTCGTALKRGDAVLERKASRQDRRWLVGLFLVAFGIIVSVASYLVGIIPMLAFGLGSLLIGFMILYLPESESIGGSVATRLLLPSLLNMENLLEDLDLDQRGIYIPVGGFGVSPKVFVPLTLTPATRNPPVGLSSSRRIFVTVGKNPEDRGILLDAPGGQILLALEQSLSNDIAKISIEDLEHSLNRGFETLGIANVISLVREDDTVQVELALRGLVQLEEKLRRSAPRLVAQIGTPLTSTVASAFAKATGKYVTLKTSLLDESNSKLRISLKLGAFPA